MDHKLAILASQNVRVYYTKYDFLFIRWVWVRSMVGMTHAQKRDPIAHAQKRDQNDHAQKRDPSALAYVNACRSSYKFVKNAASLKLKWLDCFS
jgi:hypothetical protein